MQTAQSISTNDAAMVDILLSLRGQIDISKLVYDKYPSIHANYADGTIFDTHLKNYCSYFGIHHTGSYLNERYMNEFIQSFERNFVSNSRVQRHQFHEQTFNGHLAHSSCEVYKGELKRPCWLTDRFVSQNVSVPSHTRLDRYCCQDYCTEFKIIDSASVSCKDIGPIQSHVLPPNFASNKSYNWPNDHYSEKTNSDSSESTKIQSAGFRENHSNSTYLLPKTVHLPVALQKNHVKVQSCDIPSTDSSRPRKQNGKSPEDLYTPQWVRYLGSRKEGLCDVCVPGRWLQLKDSAYWYHKQFYHGVSSTSGTYFINPIEYRIVWVQEKSKLIFLVAQGKCHQCHQFIQLFKNKKRLGHSFENMAEISRLLIEPYQNSMVPAKIVCIDPLVIQLARDSSTSLIPQSLNVSNTLLDSLKECENGNMNGCWYRHAHKCHEYK